MLEGQSLTIVGSGEQRRDFTHVADICRGLVAMAEHNFQGKTFNLGTGINYSINELAGLFGGEKTHLPARPGEAKETLADITETRQNINWAPELCLKEYVSNWKIEHGFGNN